MNLLQVKFVNYNDMFNHAATRFGQTNLNGLLETQNIDIHFTQTSMPNSSDAIRCSEAEKNRSHHVFVYFGCGNLCLSTLVVATCVCLLWLWQLVLVLRSTLLRAYCTHQVMTYVCSKSWSQQKTQHNAKVIAEDDEPQTSNRWR